jgi:hypothetical protein
MAACRSMMEPALNGFSGGVKCSARNHSWKPIVEAEYQHQRRNPANQVGINPERQAQYQPAMHQYDAAGHASRPTSLQQTAEGGDARAIAETSLSRVQITLAGEAAPAGATGVRSAQRKAIT